jgi:hypothetical protein
LRFVPLCWEKRAWGLVVAIEMGKKAYSFVHPEFNHIELGSKVVVIKSVEEFLETYFPK